MSLSKSDFKIASSCAKKLVYKKASYDTLNDANEYMEMLAQGGHIVGKYAQLIYRGGIEIKADSIGDAIAETNSLLKQNENITLFEATFFANGKVVRTDVLEKKGKVINLIEVKSKSHESEDDSAKAKKKLQEHIEDLAYQTLVLREALPEYKIHSFLLLPDKSTRTTIDGLAGWFRVNEMVEEKFEIEELPAESVIKFKKPLVEFVYEKHPDRKKYLEQLQNDNLLTLVPLDKEVEGMIKEIENRASQFITILSDGIQPEQFSLSKGCKGCEFNLGKEQDANGYRECWKELADVDPTIFDLYFGGAIGHYTSGYYLDELISDKKVSFWDIDPERFKNKKGELGSRGQRQLLQYENTKSNKEWFGDGLKSALKGLKYPLHFIDFETYLGAIPHHKGMRPYELVCFQWSCHTIEKPGADPVHSEWLNTDYDFPNFKFAESLMKQLGNTGTPLIWSPYENTVLKGILNQMEVFGYKNDVLEKWLQNITLDKDEGREGRFVDMNDLTLQYYFHPDMKGKTSIKKVLPAIWNNNPYLHKIPWFKKYAPVSGAGLNPYDKLSPIISALEEEEVVKDGTGAMKAYHELMFGAESKNAERKAQLMKLLLQYCELDTMAMVIIWRYWMDKLML
jgi:hypothetical protein